MVQAQRGLRGSRDRSQLVRHALANDVGALQFVGTSRKRRLASVERCWIADRASDVDRLARPRCVGPVVTPPLVSPIAPVRVSAPPRDRRTSVN